MKMKAAAGPGWHLPSRLEVKAEVLDPAQSLASPTALVTFQAALFR